MPASSARRWWRRASSSGRCFGGSFPGSLATNTLLEARWQTGVWLGRLWASPVHLVYGPAEKCVREARAVQRMPLADRWDREALQAVDAWPRRLEPAQEVGEARVVPEAVQPAAIPQPEAPPPVERRGPYPVYISKGDLATYGYS